MHPIPYTCPSVLYSIADATTELANPVIGETAAAWCSVILILLSAVLTGFNLYGKLVKWGGAGALGKCILSRLRVFSIRSHLIGGKLNQQ